MSANKDPDFRNIHVVPCGWMVRVRRRWEGTQIDVSNKCFNKDNYEYSYILSYKAALKYRNKIEKQFPCKCFYKKTMEEIHKMEPFRRFSEYSLRLFLKLTF